MPTYSFKCFQDEGGCGHEFEIVMSPSTYKSAQKCPLCRKKSCVHRNYALDRVDGQVRLADSEIKTVGHLAGRNTDKMSDEKLKEIEQKHKSPMLSRAQSELPPGMKRLSQNVSGKKKEVSLAEKLERSKEIKELAKERAAKIKKDDGPPRKPPKKLKVIE